MYNFINWYLISDVSHTFRNSWVHPKGDTYIEYGMFYMHWSQQSGGLESMFETRVSRAFRWFVLYNCITMHGAKNI